MIEPDGACQKQQFQCTYLYLQVVISGCLHILSSFSCMDLAIHSLGQHGTVDAIVLHLLDYARGCSWLSQTPLTDLGNSSGWITVVQAGDRMGRTLGNALADPAARRAALQLCGLTGPYKCSILLCGNSGKIFCACAVRDLMPAGQGLHALST